MAAIEGAIVVLCLVIFYTVGWANFVRKKMK
jgi:hypothetical protein